jgi:hypothetical protein
MRRTIVVLVGALALLAALAAVAVAQEGGQRFLDGKLRFGSVTVSADEVVDGDLYVFGGDVTVDGRITGDLVVFGGVVEIDGAVEGDVMTASGSVGVSGTIGGDLRAGTGRINLSGAVGEDVLTGTGQLTISGAVGEDLVFGAGLVEVSGSVGGDVLGRAATYNREGTVGGTENVTVDEPEEEPNVVGEALLRFAALFLIGLLLLLVRRRLLPKVVEAIDTAPGSVALWGLGFLVGLAVVPGVVTLVGVLLAVLFGWLGLGLIVGLLVVAITLTWIIVGVAAFVLIAVLAPLAVGTWIGNRILPGDTPAVLTMAIGLAVIVILGPVPVVGALVGFVVTVMGAGAWLRLAQRAPASAVAIEA